MLPLAADQEAVAALAIAEGLNVRDTERAVQDRLTRAVAAPRPRTPSGPEEAAPDDVALRRGLEHALGVPVRLQRRKGGGGRIVIDWAEEASDLDALYRKLGGPPL